MKKPEPKPNRNPWANFNGPGKGITAEQLAEILAEFGIKEHFDENGNGYYKREDSEPVWKRLGIK